MSFETLAEYLFLVVCVLMTLSLIGLPIRVGLNALAREPMAVPTPILGMGVVVVAGWYWYGPNGGLRPMIYLLVGAGAVTAAVIAFRGRHTWRPSFAAALRDLALPGMVAAGVTVVLVFSWGSILAESYPSNAVAGNNDIASYALLSQHVADASPEETGSIEGYDAGLRSQASFDFGSLAILAGAATGPFDDVWRYQYPLIGVAIGLIAYVLARLLDELKPGHRVLAALAGVAAVCPILFTYLWSNYFLNQILAIGLVVAACTTIVRGATRPTVAARLAHGLAAAAALAPLLASYPHMAILGPVVLVPALFFAGGTTDVLVRGAALLAQGLGALAGAVLLLPTPAWRVPSMMRELSNVEAGWPFPGYLPAEVLGFSSTMRPRHDGLAEWIPSVIILGGLAAAAVWMVRARHAPQLGRFAIAVFALALISYWYAFHSEGISYRQWKWITFFAPVLVATGVMLAAIALALILKRFTPHGEHIAIAGGVIYCVVALSNSGSVGLNIGGNPPATRLTLDLITLEDNPVVESVDALNVDLTPYWETMWAAYFLRNHEHLRLAQPTYYSVSSPAPGWTLQRRDAPIPAGVSEVRVVNDTYQLVRQ